MVDLSRREVVALAVAGAFTLGTNSSRGKSSSVDLASMPVGLELYPLLEELKKDPEATLRKVAEIGYRRVEIPTLYGTSPQEVKQRLAQAGLDCISAGSLHEAGIRTSRGANRPITTNS